jgi:hypothetical protein
MGIGDPFVEQISILLAASTQGLKNWLNLVNQNSAVADFSKIDTVHTKNWYCSNKIGTVHLNFSGKIRIKQV